MHMMISWNAWTETYWNQREQFGREKWVSRIYFLGLDQWNLNWEPELFQLPKDQKGFAPHHLVGPIFT